jgi:hypothetical protein
MGIPMNKYLEILENLKLYSPMNKKIRIGSNGDGGYVAIAGYVYDCFISAGIGDAVSFGIGDATSFDSCFVKLHPDIPSFAFDGTVNRPHTLPTNVDFVKKNIGVSSNSTTTNLKEYIVGYNNVFLKMDIEGEEWCWLMGFADSIKKIKQFVFEAHAFFPHLLTKAYTDCHCLGYDADIWTDYILEALKLLNKTHYLVHAHQNIIGPFVKIADNEYPAFLELTFIRKDCLVDGLNRGSLPIRDLDFPCGRHPMPIGVVDKDMSYYPFKF